MNNSNPLIIDSRIGGFGDVWMRFLALYSLAQLSAKVKPSIIANASLIETASFLFGDRLHFLSAPSEQSIAFSHLGLRDTLLPMLRGKRFINPFFHVLKRDRKTQRFKDRVNDFLINAVSISGRLLLPSAQSSNHYQGYMELTAFPCYRKIPWPDFLAQARLDLPALRERLKSKFPSQNGSMRLVFPSGTAHQVMPAEWALRHMPEATFAFFASDRYQDDFSSRGLKVAHFDSLESLLTLASQARQLISVDSFPSHILQTYSGDAMIVLTETIRCRTVHPAFDGKVVASTAPCNPCKHLVRGTSSPCEAGLPFCSTWDDAAYSSKVCK